MFPPNLRCFSLPRGQKEDLSPLAFEAGRLGNYSGGKIGIRRIPNHVRTVWLEALPPFCPTAALSVVGGCVRRLAAGRTPRWRGPCRAQRSSSARNDLRTGWSPSSAA